MVFKIPIQEDKKMIKIVKFSFLMLCVSLFLTLSAGAQTWDMPTPYPDKTFHTVNILQFAKEVKEATGGDITIQVHSAGSLFKHAEIRNSVRSGQVPIGEFFLSLLANENGLFGLDSLPFVATSYDEALVMWNAQKEAVIELLGKQGMMPLFSVPWPPQALYVNKEITSVADLKGTKMRAHNPLLHQLAVKLGMIPVQVEVPDIAQAFATGRVEAMMTSPSTGVNSRAWDFVDHYYDVKAWLPKNVVVVNIRAFKKLSPENQQILLEKAAEAEKRGWGMSMEENTTKVVELQKSKMVVHTDNLDEIMKGLGVAGDEMLKDWLKQTGDAGLKVINAYKDSK
jgi:TRAP-type C4-dicarboxylate transport system substrate-binding protein